MARVLLTVALVPAVVFGGHNDMFGCRGRGGCEVMELGENNWASALAEQPYFVMFYAPWCGHCKQLAPKLKSAAKKLKGSGVGIAGCDVETAPAVQQMFSDIRGFPSLKYVRSGKNSAKTAIDYNGPREGDDIERWVKEQFVKFGGALAQPVETKAFSDLYTFFGRAALDDTPVLFLVGDDKEAPSWYSKLHQGLKTKPAGDAASPEEETKNLLKDARGATKMASVKEGVDDLLAAIDAADAAAKNKGAPLFAAAFANDADTRDGFNASAGYHLYVAAVDRKNLAASALLAYPGNPVVAQRRKVDATPLEAWARSAAATAGAVAVFAAAHDTARLPDFPKPKSVLAAEERAAKRKARASAVAAVASQADLDAHCYSLASPKTCVVGVGASDADLAPLAAKYAREGFAFSKVAADAPVAAALLGDGAPAGEPGLVVVKGGKRPRAARAFGAATFAAALDNVLGGGASFAKFADGLPQWPNAEPDAAAEEPAAAAAAEEDGEGDEYDL